MTTPYRIVPALAEALEPPTDGADVTIRSVTLTPEEIEEILRLMAYERLRTMSPDHVGTLAHMMLTGQFGPGSQITFAIDSSGVPKLVDGQQRLEAAEAAGWTGLWSVRCFWSEDFSAGKIHAVMDTSQLQRTPAAIAQAVGFHQLSARIQAAIINAVRYQNCWRTEYELPPFCTAPPVLDNIRRANERLEAFEKADQIIHDQTATAPIKRRLAAPMVLAVMTETLSTMPGEAADFWRDVATNGTGIAAELRSSLMEGRPPKASKYYIVRLVAHAWNQR